MKQIFLLKVNPMGQELDPIAYCEKQKKYFLKQLKQQLSAEELKSIVIVAMVSYEDEGVEKIATLEP